MTNKRILAVLLIVIGVALGVFIYYSETSDGTAWWQKKFRLGLDLSGGSHLVYEADTSKIPAGNIGDAMDSLRDVIERRVNAFGVTEPIVQVENGGALQSGGQRLIVDLPGVTDVQEAIELINITPTLEFKVLAPGADLQATSTMPDFISSGLTGRYLKNAQVTFGQNSLNPSISVEFNSEGAALFSRITKENIGKPIGIYLDGMPISAPTVREQISNGQAEISGQFTLDEAKTLTRNLNLGALPVPIALISTETIGASLGADALNRGVTAGLIGFAVVALFMLLWYRLPGLVAIIALALYSVFLLVIFKLAGVTLTAAGIAGFVLSFGMALDGNILIFERLKEELKRGRSLSEAIREGFARAWLSIRDANLSSLIAAAVLFWFGTAFMRGFAITLALGLVVGLFTSISVTRTLLLAIVPGRPGRAAQFLFKCGLN